MERSRRTDASVRRDSVICRRDVCEKTRKLPPDFTPAKKSGNDKRETVEMIQKTARKVKII